MTFEVEEVTIMKDTMDRSHSRDQDVVDGPHRQGSILVVEDDLDISNMLRIYFESKKYKVLVAPRGAQALEACQKELPSVIILDIILPDMDGYEVCQRLKDNQRTRDVPIIFLTQKGERADERAGLGLGAVDYITKPFDISELESSVEKSIARI
jgi:DNA-binding response OmpR family regulator